MFLTRSQVSTAFIGTPFIVTSKVCADGSFWFYFGNRTGGKASRIEEESYGKVTLNQNETGLHAQGLFDGYRSPSTFQGEFREVTSTAAFVRDFVEPAGD